MPAGPVGRGTHRQGVAGDPPAPHPAPAGCSFTFLSPDYRETSLHGKLGSRKDKKGAGVSDWLKSFTAITTVDPTFPSMPTGPIELLASSKGSRTRPKVRVMCRGQCCGSSRGFWNITDTN